MAEDAYWFERVLEMSRLIRQVGVRHVFAVMYSYADPMEVTAFFGGHGRAPWVCPSRASIIYRSGCSQSQTYEHIKVLEETGFVVPERRRVEGQEIKGWLLPMISAPQDEADSRQQCDDLTRVGDGQTSAGRNYGGQEPGDVETTGPPSSVGRENLPAPSDGLPAGRKGRGPAFAINQLKSNEFNKLAKLASSKTQEDGLGATPRRRRAIALVRELSMFEPSDPSRRFKPSNPRHVELAEAFLYPVELENDAFLLDEHYNDALSACRDFRTMCETNWGDQERWWRPRMLSTKVKDGADESPWSVTEGKVKEWRTERVEREEAERENAERQAAEEHQAVTARLLELDQLAEQGEPAFARELRASNLHLAGKTKLDDRDYVADRVAGWAAFEAAKADGRAPTLLEINEAVRASHLKRTADAQLGLPACLSVVASKQERKAKP